MSGILLFTAQKIAAFGINKGLDKIFTNREDFSQRLNKIIYKTIDEYQKSYPIPDVAGNFAFYNSQILIEEFLKYRLFSISGYSLDVKEIQNELERNPKIIKPTQQELECFFQTFDKFIKEDEKFRILEIEAFHKEAIFEIYNKVESILNLLEIHLIEIVPLLEEEYKVEINNCFDEIKELKPNTALKHLTSLEERVNKNSAHVSKKLQASLKFFKGICYEALGLFIEAYEHFINAFMLVPENQKYCEKACISYYFLDNPKYKELKERIEKFDDFNSICWAIETMDSDDFIGFVNSKVDKSVLKKHHYQRLVFNNNLKKNKVDSLKLIEALDVTNLFSNLPESINYDNLHHWVFILNILSIQFFNSCDIPFWGFIKKDEKTIQILELSKLLSEAIKNSELDASYNQIVFNYYWLQSEVNIQSDTIANLKATYKSLKDKVSFRFMLLANSIQKHESLQEAVKLINEYDGELDENLISLKTFCQLENPQTEDVLIEYFNIIRHVDVLNIQNICSYLIPAIEFNIIEKERLKEIIKKLEYAKDSYKELILLLIDSLFPKDKYLDVEKIYQVQDKLDDEPKLFFFIGLLFFENKYFDDCIKFLESYVDENKECRDLALYIRALDSSKHTNQLKLLRLLKKWRTTFSFNDYFLRIEIELQQILKDWQEIQDITKYGLSKLPNDEAFYTLYIISLIMENNLSEIEKEQEKITGFNFKATENALRVASILVQSGFLDTGIELVYQKAINKEDSIARMNFFGLTANFPEAYFKEFDIVTENCFVKYEIDGEVHTIQINSNTKSSPIVQKSIGKNAFETFTIENPLTHILKHVRVLRIMNKYLSLSDEIITEANSSFSNLPVVSLKFEKADIESFEKALIENFGASEEQRREHFIQNLSKYHKYSLSFTELTNANFNGSYIDAYYILVSNQSEGFIVKPIKYFNKAITAKNKKLIIDFSSGLLFFELSEKLGLIYNKFIVSETIYLLIDKLISKTDYERNSKMSVSLYNNKIIPHFYPEDYHDKRIESLKKIKKWFKENSEIENPGEKVEIIRPLYQNGKITNEIEFIIDNSFLAQREDYLLITDDLGYEKMLKVNNWTSSEKYLVESFPDKKNEILEAMLSYRYVGITLNADILYSSFINQYKESSSHIYNYALQNISLPVNFNPFNVFIVVDYLKKLALNSTLTREKYKYEATNILTMLISSFSNPSFGFSLKTRIEQQFQLMGDYLNITLNSLLDALRINTPK